MIGRSRQFWARVLCVALVFLAGPALAEDRYALVIGNSRYADPPLATPPNNASLIRDVLFDLGFQVTLERDLDAEGLRRALKRFGARLQRSSGSIAVLYYSGIAAQVNQANYLVPIGAPPAHGNELPQKAVEFGEVISQMQQGSSLGRIAVIDASPRAGDFLPVDVRPGLAATRTPPGFLLAFSAQPDRLATPPIERNSYYAQAFDEVLRVPGLPAEVLFSRVRRLVADRTGQKQQTWYSSALNQSLFLNPPADQPNVNVDTAQAEARFWSSIRGSPDTSGPEAYLQRYPDGIYADEARRALQANAPAAVNLLGAGTVFRDCERCPELVVVEPGSFERGASFGPDNEKPAHQVTISRALSIGRYEVTYAEWEVCVADGGCSWRPPGRPDRERDRLPVVFVSWNDAQQYVGWLSKKTGEPYRLPTEAEWEYVARAGGRSDYPWGPTVGSGHANCYGCRGNPGPEAALPVGRFAPNAYGLYDVIGNAWEWTRDCYVDSYQAAPRDGSEQLSGYCTWRVFRGGSWYDEPERVRLGFRNGGLPTLRSPYVGLRVVRELR